MRREFDLKDFFMDDDEEEGMKADKDIPFQGMTEEESLDEAKKEICRKRWQGMFDDVHGFLCNALSSPGTGATERNTEAVLRCLVGWMRLVVPSEQTLLQSPLLPVAIRAMPSEAAFDIVIDCDIPLSCCDALVSRQTCQNKNTDALRCETCEKCFSAAVRTGIANTRFSIQPIKVLCQRVG